MTYYTVTCETPRRTYKIGKLFKTKNEATQFLWKLYLDKVWANMGTSNKVRPHRTLDQFAIIYSPKKQTYITNVYDVQKIYGNYGFPVFLHQPDGGVIIQYMR